MNKIKERFPHIIFYAVISFITFFIFFDFFAKGYVLDGQYDRRDNALPYYFIFLHSFQNLEIPQWNPFFFCGNTIFSNSTYTFFYPFNWIVWLSSESHFPAVASGVLIIHFLFAGYFMWILLKELIKDEFWALCGSAAYLLSTSSMFSLFVTEQFSIFVYSPALIYLIITFDKRNLLANFLLQGITLALFLLIGQVQYVIYVIGLYLLFVSYSSLEWEDGRLKINWGLLSVSAASFLVALLITSVRYLPFYFSTSGNAFLKVSYDQFLSDNGTAPRSLLMLFMPHFFIFANRGEAYNCYTGVFTAFLGLYAIFFLHDKKTLFWKIIVIAITLIIIRTPLAYLHYVLTGKGNLSFGRMALLIPIGFSILSGFAGKTMMDNIRHLGRSLIFFVCLFIFVIVCSIAIYLNPGFPLGSENRTTETEWMKSSIMHLSIFFVLMTWLLIFVRMSKAKYKAEIFKAIFLLLILLDLLIIAKYDINSQNPAFSPEPFYKSLPREREIAVRSAEGNKNFRILGLSEGTWKNRAISLNLYNSSGFESIPPFYPHTLYSYPYFIPRNMARELVPMNRKVLQLTSTRFILFDDFVQEIPSSLPRYSLYNDYTVINDDDKALYTLLGAAVDIHNVVVLNRFPDIPIAGLSNDRMIRGTVTVVKERFNDILFEVVSPNNTLLLLNDTYDEGWKTYIDAREAAVIRANYAFRAVAVPAGVHKVLFSFSARGFKEGKTISLVSLLGFFCIAAFGVYRHFSSSRG